MMIIDEDATGEHDLLFTNVWGTRCLTTFMNCTTELMRRGYISEARIDTRVADRHLPLYDRAMIYVCDIQNACIGDEG